MAKLPANSAITFKGKLSNVVGVEWNGLFVLRAAPQWKKKYKPTQKQVVNQARFRFANAFVKDFKFLLDRTVEKEIGQTRASSVMQTLLREAIVGQYPDFQLDYSRVPVARGTLLPAASPVATPLPGGDIEFRWEDDSDKYAASRQYTYNSAMLIAIREDRNKVAYELYGPSRNAKSATLRGSFKKGDKVHTWISFCSGDFLLKANSVYAGMITIR